MKANELRAQRRTRRKKGIRKTIFGVPARPRLTVYRSNLHIYAQVIDDLSGRTLAAASTTDKERRASGGCNVSAATGVGTALAEQAKAAGVEAVVFDRNGYRFHERVKALADAAREGGLKF